MSDKKRIEQYKKTELVDLVYKLLAERKRNKATIKALRLALWLSTRGRKEQLTTIKKRVLQMLPEEYRKVLNSTS